MRNATAIARMFEAHGFTLLRGKGHKIWLCACGHGKVTTTGGDGKGRGDKNATGQMRRTLRECEALRKQKEESEQ